MLEQVYLGIDIDDEYAIISRFKAGMAEPQTVSQTTGTEIFQIPAALTKGTSDDWYISADGSVDKLLGRAIRHEKVYVAGHVYPARDLITVYLRKLIKMAMGEADMSNIARIAITLPALSREATELFFDAAAKLGLSKDKIMLLDRKESFFYYAYSQHEGLCLYDVFLFDCRGSNLSCCVLERNKHTRPQVVTAYDEIHRFMSSDKDGAFLGVLEKLFSGRIISSVYLIGDGFDGDWMKRSVAFMCQGRRAFKGKNLYSKGACYAAGIRTGDTPWPYVYMGENVMKVNIFLKVANKGHMDFAPLITAGDNWYDSNGECDVILGDGRDIDFWIQPPHSREARIEQITLDDLPERPNRTTRLHISARPLSDKAVRINITDMGFGEYFKSSGKVFDYTIKL